ncbi:helix-turn-helix protein [Vibrio mediterranei]|jgi:transcriptional regulator with XRE-family HTH domain|uniref:XRE family transcriptional regulator n=1 Tax=Vibrio mediterranei TaxID=689 RepID=A0A3G4V9L7_9VIBR|nr:helix-turn-helix transcriptional regulator [Vibrio mediterranei]AYV19833.1 XRE family transcriptional regulator [Vibrio mediterranei]AYV19841.1 XRE family transcriptional regulator [Vibrio mediterranei]SBO13086.1 helix-turn-helix protein [Vibrio mediterranei]
MSNEILRELRIKNSLTQKDVAEIMGVSNITYMKYENGETEPKFSQMMKALVALGAGIKDIFGNLSTSVDDSLAYNMQRIEILDPSERECLNQIVEAMLLKHQIESVQRKPSS